MGRLGSGESSSAAGRTRFEGLVLDGSRGRLASGSALALPAVLDAALGAVVSVAVGFIAVDDDLRVVPFV